MKTTTAFVIAGLACGTFATGCNSSSSSPEDGGTTSSSGSASSSGSTTSSSSGTGTSSGSTSSSSGGEGGVSDSGVPDGGVPAVPTLGAQIDRMGRPAINTALNNELSELSTSSTAMITADTAKDMYNADKNPADWATNWVPTFESSLPIYDGLDGVCGNQLAYGALGNPAYATLATVLANDMLWLNTGSAACTTYLAVEANALGVTNTDCGGRGLSYNTIDATYNALAGTLSFTTPPGPVTNGVTMPASAPSTTFPFLASAH